MRTLVNLVLTNSEFRKLIKDFSVVGRDLAAKVIAPSAEQLKGADEGAPEGHFVPDEERLETRLPGVNGQADAIDPGEVKRSVDAEVSTNDEEGKKVSGLMGKVKVGGFHLSASSYTHDTSRMVYRTRSLSSTKIV